jgi:hypothetical protein
MYSIRSKSIKTPLHPPKVSMSASYEVENTHEDTQRTFLDALPHEVTAQVFHSCLPTRDERLSSPLHTLAPLTLSWVCRSWRHLCLSLPELWITLTLGHRGSNPDSDVEALKMWLKRSGHLPVSLSFNYVVDDAFSPILFDRDSNHRYVKGMEALLRVALSSIDRWKSFQIHVLDISFLDNLLMSLTMGAPLLQVLALSTKYLGFFGDVHLLDFSLCPSLRSVHLSTTMLTPTAQTAAMTNMTKLEMRFCTSIEDCLRWIDLCPALESLVVRMFCSRPELISEQALRPPVGADRKIRRLSHLTYLEVHGFSTDSDPGPLLDQLDLPALDTFLLTMYDTIESTPHWTHVTDLVRRSSPPLKHLKLSSSPLTVDNIIACLRDLPRLERLSVRQLWDCDELLSALSPSTGQTSMLCHSLESLDVVNSSWTTESLASMLQRRVHKRECGDYVKSISEVIMNDGILHQVLKHPAMNECVSNGVRLVGAKGDDLSAAFSEPRVVFV